MNVTGQDDSLQDSDVAFSIVTAAAMSDDRAYDAIDPPDVAVTNFDDDAVTTNALYVADIDFQSLV